MPIGVAVSGLVLLWCGLRAGGELLIHLHQLRDGLGLGEPVLFAVLADALEAVGLHDGDIVPLVRRAQHRRHRHLVVQVGEAEID